MKRIDLLSQDKLPAEEILKLNEVTKIIYKSKKAVVLTGAGISCNAGIPDFRSSDGLYSLVKSKYPKNFIKGQDLFDISLFRNELTLSLFCTFMEGLYKSSLQAKPTETHRFIKHLKEKNKLLRCYTQNIDSLEANINLNCGVDLSNFDNAKNFNKTWKNLDVIQLHGNLHKLSCTQCFKNFEWTPDHQVKLAQGENPECENCYSNYQQRLFSGKRITGAIGMLRPDIVLYGENHPQSEILTRGLNLDMGLRLDLLIIMGTSLKVDGVKRLVRSYAKNIHERGGAVIFVNKTPLSKQWEGVVDYEVVSDCDDFVRVLRHEIPDLFMTQEQLDSEKLKKKTVKKEKIKHEVKQEVTPPSTPSKDRIKKERPTLSRKPSMRLPLPALSFSEDDVYIKVEDEYVSASDVRPLAELPTNTNLRRSRIKQESDMTDDIPMAKRARV